MTTATFNLVCDTTTIPLIFNANSQTGYRMGYQSRMALEATRVLQHLPDFGESQPVRGFDPNRTYFLELDVGSNEIGKYILQGFDAPTDNLTLVKRLVDGANQQALRYYVDCDVDPVYLDVQLQGATTLTRHRVKWGFVDDGNSPYDNLASNSQVYRNVIIALTLEPYGEGVPFTLRQDSGGSPDMTTGSPLSTGLVDIGAPTFSIDTTNFLINGKSQKVVTDGATVQGFDTPAVTTALLDNVGYIWLHIETGGDDIEVQLKTDIGTLDTKVLTVNDDNNVSDQQVKDDAGNTWYRVALSGTSVLPITSAWLRVRRTVATTATTFYADAYYIQTGTTVIPSAWVSVFGIQNAEDSTRTNHVDIWGVAGDAPALVTHKLVNSNSTITQNFIFSRGVDGKLPINDKIYWIDSDLFTDTAGTWATIADASRSGGSYLRMTAGATGVLEFDATDALESKQILETTRRLLAIVAFPDLLATVEASSENPTGVLTSTPNGVNVATEFELVDVGVLNGTGVIPDNTPSGVDPKLKITLTFTPDSANFPLEFDALALYFADDDFILGSLADVIGTGNEVWVVGEGVEQGYVVNEVAGSRENNVIGRMWTLAVGQTTNRIIYTLHSLTNEHQPSATFEVEYEITPRTRHLLGVI